MSNAARRMVVQKYNNRPPFQFKGQKEPSTVSKNYKKSFENVEKSFQSIMNHFDLIQSDEESDQIQTENFENNPKPDSKQKDMKCTNMGPKILKSFQNITPKNQSIESRSRYNDKVVKKSSAPVSAKDGKGPALQTLFRNKNVNFYNKHKTNIPDHKLMKNLLHNVQIEPMEAENKIKTEISIASKKRSITSMKKPSVQKFDKATSITDLVTVVPEVKKPLATLNTNHATKSKTHKSHSLDHNGKQNRRRIVSSPFTDKNKIISSPSDVDVDEGTFVLEADRVYETNEEKCESHPMKKILESGREIVGKMVAKHSQANSKFTGTGNYIGMMNTVKNKLPKLDDTTEQEQSNSDNCEWLNTSAESESTTPVKFPKETRGANERLMDMSKKNKLRTPLAKYAKPKKELMSIQPAISVNRMEGPNMRNRNKKLPYTICRKFEVTPSSKESGAIGDHISSTIVSRKVPSGSRLPRKVQKSR